jgi:hypothetical protein
MTGTGFLSLYTLLIILYLEVFFVPLVLVI